MNKDAELCVAASPDGYCLDSPCPTTMGSTCPRIVYVKHCRMTAEQVRGHLTNCRSHVYLSGLLSDTPKLQLGQKGRSSNQNAVLDIVTPQASSMTLNQAS